MRAGLLIAVALLAAVSVASAGAPPPQDAPAAPTTEVPPPPPLTTETPGTAEPEADESVPEVTITTKDGETRAEYRIEGRLYMIKVTPAKGKPYYLIDYEGSGEFRHSDLDPRISPPMWVIKRW